MIPFKVPMDRIGVIIGKDGKVKKNIEEITHTKIVIDGATGTVQINRNEEENTNIGDWIAHNIIKAIARGFNPKIASKLTDEEYLIEIIDLEDIIGRNKKNIQRVKARLIGESGKTWKNIENLADVNISIYGNSLGIIGKYEELKIAREAVQKLISGQKHSTVYKFLRKKHNELKKKYMTEIWKPYSEF